MIFRHLTIALPMAEPFHKDLGKQRKAEQERLKQGEKQLDQRLEDLREQIKSLNKEASSDTPKAVDLRNKVHCDILRLEKEPREKRVEREHGMPVAFENELAKVDLIEQRPGRKKDTERIIAEGRASE